MFARVGICPWGVARLGQFWGKSTPVISCFTVFCEQLSKPGVALKPSKIGGSGAFLSYVLTSLGCAWKDRSELLT